MAGLSSVTSTSSCLPDSAAGDGTSGSPSDSGMLSSFSDASPDAVLDPAGPLPAGSDDDLNINSGPLTPHPPNPTFMYISDNDDVV